MPGNIRLEMGYMCWMFDWQKTSTINTGLYYGESIEGGS